MPFKSKAQWHKFFAMANRGEIPMSKAKEWARETKSFKALPEHKRKKHKGHKRKKRKKRLRKRLMIMSVSVK